MDTITVSAVIGDDRRLQIDLPDDAPTGEVEVIVRRIEPPQPESESNSAYEIPPNPAREAARAKLLAANFLVTGIRAPEGTVPLTAEERMRIGTLPPGARPSEELIDEDRGEW
jgi:hypothetical protein